MIDWSDLTVTEVANILKARFNNNTIGVECFPSPDMHGYVRVQVIMKTGIDYGISTAGDFSPSQSLENVTEVLAQSIDRYFESQKEKVNE